MDTHVKKVNDHLRLVQNYAGMDTHLIFLPENDYFNKISSISTRDNAHQLALSHNELKDVLPRPYNTKYVMKFIHTGYIYFNYKSPANNEREALKIFISLDFDKIRNEPKPKNKANDTGFNIIKEMEYTINQSKNTDNKFVEFMRYSNHSGFKGKFATKHGMETSIQEAIELLSEQLNTEAVKIIEDNNYLPDYPIFDKEYDDETYSILLNSNMTPAEDEILYMIKLYHDYIGLNLRRKNPDEFIELLAVSHIRHHLSDLRIKALVGYILANDIGDITPNFLLSGACRIPERYIIGKSTPHLNLKTVTLAP